MAYNETLADRIRQFFDENNIQIEEKKMFGGWCVMLDEKMCIGVLIHKKLAEDAIMCRVHPEMMEELLSKPHCIEMDFGGKPMNGFVFVTEDGYRSKKDLDYWCQLCIDYNPLAKKSPPKKKTN